MLKNIIQLIIFCGVVVYAAPSFKTNRIVNGSNADIEDFIYVVSLRFFNNHTCGASLISPNWVLTAAHCVYSYKNYPNYYSIQYNSTNIARNSTSVTGIAQMIINEGYNRQYAFNDISLLRTVDPVILPMYASLLSQFTDTMPGINCTLVGWGYERSNGQLQTNLQKVILQIYSYNVCAQRHSSPLIPSNICAGVEGGGKGQCSGDSGGPLIVNGVVVGIVSWSRKPCTIAPYPGVFTQVSYYREWIRQRTGV